MITNMDDAQAALQAAISDTEGDHPDVAIDDMVPDLIASLSYDMSDAVYLELCRRELGFVPSGGRLPPLDLMNETEW